MKLLLTKEYGVITDINIDRFDSFAVFNKYDKKKCEKCPNESKCYIDYCECRFCYNCIYHCIFVINDTYLIMCPKCQKISKKLYKIQYVNY